MGRTILGTCLAAALLVAAGDGARAGDEARIIRTPEFTARVKASIDKGVAWLRLVQQKDGRFERFGATEIETTALACHALRASKVSPDDPTLVSAIAAVRNSYDEEKRFKDRVRSQFGTEDCALMCIAIADLGVWNVVNPSTNEISISIRSEDRAWFGDLVRFLEQTQRRDGNWAQFANDTDGSFDFGFTYKSILALKAASRSAVKIKGAVWDRAIQYLLRTQEPGSRPIPSDGKSKPRPRGWELTKSADTQRLDPDESSTANAVATLTVCESELAADPKIPPQSRAKVEAAIRDGLAWLAAHTYFLDHVRDRSVRFPLEAYDVAYSLERALDLTGVERLGTRDWYGDLAAGLMAAQSSDGSWRDLQGGNAELDHQDDVKTTCLALLVLGRGTPRVQWTVTTLDDSDINFAVAPSLSDKDFADFLDLVLSRWRRVDDAAVKERLLAKTTAVGPRIVPPLIARLSSTKDDDRAAAFALLKRATGVDNGYDPSAPTDKRGAAVAAWKTWLAANEKTLHFDAAKGLLIP